MESRGNPFKVVMQTAYGPVCLGVEPCHVASLSSPVDPATLKIVPLTIDSVDVGVDGKAVRGMDGWDFSAVKAYALGGKALPISSWRDLVDALDDMLSGEERRFVEADLVRIAGARRDRDAQIAAVKEEIARRQRKLDQMVADREEQERMLAPREAALRSLLADLRQDAQGAGARPLR